MYSCKPFYEVDSCYFGRDLVLYVNTEKCTITPSIKYDKAVGTQVWHGIDFEFKISAWATQQEVDFLIEKIKPLIEEIKEHSEVKWNGNNMVRIFTEEAKMALEEAEEICRDFDPEETENCQDENCVYCNPGDV